jgi:hypothetical protein
VWESASAPVQGTLSGASRPCSYRLTRSRTGTSPAVGARIPPHAPRARTPLLRPGPPPRSRHGHPLLRRPGFRPRPRPRPEGPHLRRTGRQSTLGRGSSLTARHHRRAPRPQPRSGRAQGRSIRRPNATRAAIASRGRWWADQRAIIRVSTRIPPNGRKRSHIPPTRARFMHPIPAIQAPYFPISTAVFPSRDPVPGGSPTRGSTKGLDSNQSRPITWNVGRSPASPPHRNARKARGGRPVRRWTATSPVDGTLDSGCSAHPTGPRCGAVGPRHRPTHEAPCCTPCDHVRRRQTVRMPATTQQPGAHPVPRVRHP